MLFCVSLIVIFAAVGVAGMPTRRNAEGSPDVVSNGRISSMVIKGIVIGTLLSIGAFLLLHFYRKCLFPASAPAVPPMQSSSATTSAPSALAPSPLAFNMARSSLHIAYPPSTAGKTASGGSSMYATPRAQGGAHAMKTKFTAPVAGPRATPIHKTVIV